MTAVTPSMTLRSKTFLRLIRFEHTLFALPYAVAGAFLAAGGPPEPSTCWWILAAMVAARTAAMSFNRLLDRELDADNPRTATRASASGEIGPTFLSVVTAAMSALFVFSAWMLGNLVEGRLAFILSFPTLVVLLGYSTTKRFFAGSHFVLGIALGLSPLGAWVAVRGDLGEDAWAAVALSFAVLFWTAGFDILYALQDEEHDQRVGLHSIPARYGTSAALWFARLTHAMVPVALYAAGIAADRGWVYHGMVVVVAALLIYEHFLVRGGRLDRIQVAFFRVNIAIAFLVMIATIVDLCFWETRLS